MQERGVYECQAWQQMQALLFPGRIEFVIYASLLEQMRVLECLETIECLRNLLPAKVYNSIVTIQSKRWIKNTMLILTPHPMSRAVLRVPPFSGIYCASFSMYWPAPPGNIVPPPGKVKCSPSLFIHPWWPFRSAILLYGMFACQIWKFKHPTFNILSKP